jgi:heat shock protein HslJ
MKRGLAAFAVLLVSACGNDANVPATLVGHWTVAEFGTVGNIINPSWEPRANVEFTDGGELRGHTGCNAFGGDFTMEDNRIVFGRVNITLAGCPRDAMLEQERAFHDLFQDSPEIEFEGGRVTLTASSTNTVFVLVPR